MRKGHNGEETGQKRGKKKRMIKIVATTSLPAVDRPNAKQNTKISICVEK